MKIINHGMSHVFQSFPLSVIPLGTTKHTHHSCPSAWCIMPVLPHGLLFADF